MRNKGIIGLAVVAAVGCGIYILKYNDPGPVAGGPCSYTTVEYPAVVIDVSEVADEQSEIVVLLDHYGENDTLSYFSEQGIYADNLVIKEKGMKVGDTLIYECQEIVTGTCSPSICGLKLERFVK